MSMHRKDHNDGTSKMPACGNESVPLPLSRYLREKEVALCFGKYSPSKLVLTAAAIFYAGASYSSEMTDPGSSSGSVFSGTKSAIEPVLDGVASVIAGIAAGIWYIFSNASAAVLVSALLASTLAALSIRSQRQMTRLRETFATVDRGNWDKDLIKSRQDFKRIRSDLEESGGNIAIYHNPDKKRIADAVTLNSILKDYENIALGVRHHILDEEYLHRWMRTMLTHDWAVLSPLVTAMRSKDGVPNAYVEFEGLAAAWHKNRSYRTGRKIRPPKRTIRIN